MANEPAPPPQAGAKPGIFQNINTTIAGLTGLVIALGSLAAAWTTIFPKKEGAKQEQVAGANEEAGEGVSDDASAVAEKPKKYTGTLYADGTYEGDAITLEEDGQNWVLTIGDNEPVYYAEQKSAGEAWLLAYDKEGEKHLSWQVDGGEVQIGNRNQDEWKTYAWVQPAAAEQPVAEEATPEEPPAE